MTMEPRAASQDGDNLNCNGITRERAGLGKIPFGQDTHILCSDLVPAKNVEMRIAQSTLTIPDHLKEALKQKQAEIAANPNRWDGQKWRTESLETASEGGEKRIVIKISPMVYSEHDLLKKEAFSDIKNYPNPITVNAAQETNDGYLLLAVKDGQVSDQTGIGMLGAGFVERKDSSEPMSVLSTTALEAASETAYERNGEAVSIPFDMDNAKAMGAVFGSNRDTTVAVYMPLDVSSDAVRLGQNLNKNGKLVCEHQLAVLVPNDLDTISKVLNDGAIEIPINMVGATSESESIKLKLVDHALGVLHLYKLHRESGQISPQAHAEGGIKFVRKDEGA